MGRGGLDGRLRKLEDRADPERYALSEEQEKEQWLLRARFERVRLAGENADARHARSLIGLFRVQHFLPGMGVDELVGRILDWRPLPAGGRSRVAVEREVALAIHRGKPGTESMACPPRWRTSFAAGDELRKRWLAISDEDLAEYYLRRERIEEEGDEEELERWAADYEEGLGIPRGLEEEFVGPDAGAITAEERQRRIDEYLADLVFGEKGYRVARHMERLAGSRFGAPAGGEGGG